MTTRSSSFSVYDRRHGDGTISFVGFSSLVEPHSEIGATAQRIDGEGIEAADRAKLHREIACNNGARIIADPSVALDAITHRQSTFNRPPNGQDAGNEVDAAERLNAVALPIARLIGRWMAREDIAARIATANDNDASPEEE